MTSQGDIANSRYNVAVKTNSSMPIGGSKISDGCDLLLKVDKIGNN